MTIAALAARNTPTGDYQEECGWFFSRLALFLINAKQACIREGSMIEPRAGGVREIIRTRRSVTLAALQLCPTFSDRYQAARVSRERLALRPILRTRTLVSDSGRAAPP